MKNYLNIFQKFFKKTPQKNSLRATIKKKYLAFQRLLAENNHVLRLMADMEEKRSEEYLFDRQYIHAHAKAITDGVINIIKYLNTLSNDKYTGLYARHNAINGELEKILTQRQEITFSDLVIPLEALRQDMWNIAGGKMAHLGEVKNGLGLSTPNGFSITAYAFQQFMEQNRIFEKINERLSSLGIDDIEKLNEVSRTIQKMVIQSEIPRDLEAEIKTAYARLCKNAGKEIRVSVRSSALHEDGEVSFAGQYATFLNIPGDLILQKYKEVVASLFTPRAIFYCKTKGFSAGEMVMAVGVLRMVEAKAAGVMYTREPHEPDKDVMIMNAVWGLRKSVDDGTLDPHYFIVSRETGDVLKQRVPEQRTMLVCPTEGDVKSIAVPDAMKNSPCLTREQIRTLVRDAVALEKHYGRPQDIEWAIGEDDLPCILQSRPLRILTMQDSTATMPRRMDGYPILIERGVIACKGIGFGKAFVLKDEQDLDHFPEGAVLVARHTSIKFVTVMHKASAIITDVGGATGHMASLAREYQVPTILDTETATSAIKDGQELTVDAVNCNVYEGKVEKLLEYSSKKKESFKDTALFTMFERALQVMVPLNLVDPDSERFTPEYCKTFHDITRFAHEMSMAEIFKTGIGEDIDSLEDVMSAVAFAKEGEDSSLGAQTQVLKAGIPIDAHLLDIEGGIQGKGKKVTPEEITSIPFSAFLKGLKSMRWPEPRPTDVRGFLGMIAHTAAIPEEELRKTGAKSYAIVSRNYMNFSIRLGYHFSMVEAYAGENINDNYIKFFFKGGGAAIDRRLRRVRLIQGILKKMDFKVNVVGDVMDAMLTKYKQPTIEKKLEVMGKLTVYTKQLDMVMYNDEVTDLFEKDFIRDHVK